MSFQFRMESLLKYRRHQLEQCQRLFSEVLQDQSNCESEMISNQQARSQVLDAIRDDTTTGRIDVRRLASLRYDVTQLDHGQLELKSRQNRIHQQLALCRQAIQQADAAVKALERLKDKQLEKYEIEQRKKSDVELQDTWSSTQQTAAMGGQI